MFWTIQAMQMHHSVFSIHRIKWNAIYKIWSVFVVAFCLVYSVSLLLLDFQFQIWMLHIKNLKWHTMTYDWLIKMSPKAIKSGENAMSDCSKFYSLVELVVCGHKRFQFRTRFFNFIYQPYRYWLLWIYNGMDFPVDCTFPKCMQYTKCFSGKYWFWII